MLGCAGSVPPHGRAVSRSARGGKGVAAQCVALTSAIYAFAIERGLCADNPARGVKKAAVRKVERFLSEAEIARLAVALDAEVEASGNPYPTAAIELLLLTGCRRGEVVDLCWDYVDFEHNCLRLPDSKTGAKIVYLNAPARALLQALPRLKNNPPVIPGIRAESASAAIDKAWPRVRQAANLAGGGRVVGQIPVCWDPDRGAAIKRAHEQFRWFAGGWKVNADLPTPAGFAGDRPSSSPNVSNTRGTSSFTAMA